MNSFCHQSGVVCVFFFFFPHPSPTRRTHSVLTLVRHGHARTRARRIRDHWGWRSDAEQAARDGDVAKFKSAALKAKSPREVLELCEARLLPIRCCEAGHLDMLKHLFEKVGVCKEVCAVREWQRAMCEGGGVGNSPLMAASWSGHAHLVRYCLESGCAANTTNNSGVTPIFMAAHCGHHEVVRLLVMVWNAAPHTQYNNKTHRTSEPSVPSTATEGIPPRFFMTRPVMDFAWIPSLNRIFTLAGFHYFCTHG